MKTDKQIMRMAIKIIRTQMLAHYTKNEQTDIHTEIIVDFTRLIKRAILHFDIRLMELF